MKKYRSRVLCVCVALMVSTASPTHAAEARSAAEGDEFSLELDPTVRLSEQADIQIPLPDDYLVLSPEEQDLVPTEASLELVSSQPTAPTTTIATFAPGGPYERCGTAWGKVTHSNRVGKIHSYKVSVRRCWSGGKITYVSQSWKDPYVFQWAAASWTFEKTVTQSQYWVTSTKTSHASYAKGQFKYAPPPKVWTLYTSFPWVRLYVRGNGTIRMEGRAT